MPGEIAAPSGSSRIRSAASQVVVEQRLALAHENDVGLRFQRVAIVVQRNEHLPDNLARAQIRTNPSVAVRQNLQSTAQPACVEMQIVWRFSSGMNTVSIFAALPSPIART